MVSAALVFSSIANTMVVALGGVVTIAMGHICDPNNLVKFLGVDRNTPRDALDAITQADLHTRTTTLVAAFNTSARIEGGLLLACALGAMYNFILPLRSRVSFHFFGMCVGLLVGSIDGSISGLLKFGNNPVVTPELQRATKLLFFVQMGVASSSAIAFVLCLCADADEHRSHVTKEEHNATSDK